MQLKKEKRISMKIFLILLVSALCACNPPHDTVRMFWPESLASLDEATRRCRASAENLEAAARQAEQEDLPGAERLLRALARAERIQERSCVEAIRRLGGRYTPPARIVVRIRTTRDNLEQLLLSLRDDRTPAGTIDRAIEEGNRYAARLLIRSAAAENRRLRLVESYLQRGERNTSAYWVCPRCGYLCDEGHRDPYCPQCQTSGERFLRF